MPHKSIFPKLVVGYSSLRRCLRCCLLMPNALIYCWNTGSMLLFLLDDLEWGITMATNEESLDSLQRSPRAFPSGISRLLHLLFIHQEKGRKISPSRCQSHRLCLGTIVRGEMLSWIDHWLDLLCNAFLYCFSEMNHYFQGWQRNISHN